jgi:hypothetical protein
MQLPALNQVAAALRKTTEVLARELAVPSDEAPAWTEFEWQMACAVAAMHGVSPLLCARLRWEGPAGFRQFLVEQRDQSVGRYSRIRQLLDAIDSQARREGLALVALKGAALHASRIYTAGERPMGDIDLLARQEDAAAISRVLDACDYTDAFTTQRHRVFQPRVKTLGGRLGEDVDNPLKIEVHTRIAEPLPVTTTDVTQFLLPRAAHPGLNGYPSPAALMMHLLLHAAGNIRARALRLIQLHDIALLAGQLRADDWEELLAARPDGRTLWWAAAPVMLTVRYYPAAIPRDVLARLARDCPWLLRLRTRRQQLTDVSWSNIRVEAFPGIEWARTPQDAVAFMSGRIWPSRAARLELQEGHEQIPGSATIPWYGISHGARILRWVFSKPPRVQTLLSVRAALARHTEESSNRGSQ